MQRLSELRGKPQERDGMPVTEQTSETV